MSADPLPLRAGDEGDAVRDVQTRLDGLDLSSAADDPGCYGPATDAAVRGFQRARGLRVRSVFKPCVAETILASIRSTSLAPVNASS
jgi:peptidoglycan hydrolase-like protein with peptidoglycan-binding domain